MIGQRRLAVMPWSELAVLAGLWLAVACYVVPKALISPVSQLLGGDPQYADIGTVFDKAGAVARYADLRLAESVPGSLLSDPPRIIGSVIAARTAWVLAIVSASLFAATAVIASRQPAKSFVRLSGLDRLDFDGLWRPGLAVAVIYLAVGLYVRVIDSSSLELLKGQSAVLDATTRDGLALGLYGVTTVIAAPLGEEIFYRGFVFAGLAEWGFWPAALASSALFALSHLDPATIVPFTLVGLTLCWLFWRSGSLWDAIAFHMLFNLLSFILLLARS